MKTTILLLLCLPFLLYAQKIQIKNDKISFNDKEIAIMKSPYRNHYEFYTLNNKKVFEADLKGVALAKDEFLYYLDMKSAGGETTQIPYEVLMNSLKPARIIVHQLTVKYKLFNEKGIDENEISQFFSIPRENLEDKYVQAKANSMADESKRSSRLNNIRTVYNPRLGSKGEILINNGSYPAKIIGYIRAYNCTGFSDVGPCLEVWDLDGIKVGTMYQAKQGIKNYIVKTFDGNEFSFTATRVYAVSDYAFVNEFVANLFLEGYRLEHEASYKNQELNQAKLKDAVDRSINLYDVPGYIVDKSGKKTEGLLTIWFEKLDPERTGQKLPTEGADKFGQKLNLKTTIPGGSIRTKVYNADSGIHFCIPSANGEDCYYGLEVKGELMKKLQNYGDLHGNTAYFYRLLASEKGIMLLQDPVELQKYVIKTVNQLKAQMLDNRSNEKLSDKLADYLKDCKSISESLKKENLDLKNQENLINIVEEYSRCKK